MARIIDPEKCVACGSCIGECPVEAIYEGDVYTIDADACIDCGACEATCPNEAISEDYYYTGNSQTNAEAERSKEFNSYNSSENVSFTKSEEKYLNDLKEFMSDGANLSARDQKLLDRFRESLGISEERAQELKDYLLHPQLTDKEQQYFDSVKEYLEDGVELSSRERKMLERIRESLGISEDRAREIEGMILKPQLTEDEQEYVDMYREYAANGEITEKDRRKLDKYASILGISPKRAKELEEL